jgi:hypothetical protein
MAEHLSDHDYWIGNYMSIRIDDGHTARSSEAARESLKLIHCKPCVLLIPRDGMLDLLTRVKLPQVVLFPF